MNEYEVEITIKGDCGDDTRQAIRDIKASLREWGFLAEVEIEKLSVKQVRCLQE
ncbi:MAG: hypothetical protein ACOC6F_02970 [bacterium]